MRTYRVLFLCTGNSARSILAEASLRHRGGERFAAFSAGSHPRGSVHPTALQLLEQLGLGTAGLRSKSWQEFSGEGAPELDFVFTVCDAAAGEACPFWPGQPLTAHWGVADPAAFEGPPEAQLRVFRRAWTELDRRVARLTELPLETLDPMRLQQELDAIGKT